MNGKKVACIVLLITVAIFAYSVQILHQKSEDKRLAAEQTESEAFAAQSERETEDIRVQAMKANTADLRNFLGAWREPIDRLQTQTEVEEQVQASIRSAGLVVSSLRFEKRDSSTSPTIPRLVKASLIIKDDYPKTINWIGELERRIPLCRILSYHITGGDDARQIQADLTMEIPLMDLKAKPTPTI
jgi:hypothetical protein